MHIGLFEGMGEKEMSSDLYTSEIDSEKHGDLFLEMIVDGTLRIVTVDYHESTSFSIPPTPEGWKEAENLIGALREWVRHTKEIQGTSDELPKCEKCSEGNTQHTSFMKEDGVTITHVYGCNRCSNGWSEEEKQ